MKKILLVALLGALVVTPSISSTITGTKYTYVLTKRMPAGLMANCYYDVYESGKFSHKMSKMISIMDSCPAL